jgi:ribosomal protein L37E
MTCKDSCVHYPVCKDTVADENWTVEAIRQMYSPPNCDNFKFNSAKGTWLYYSTTMMECSVCGRHTAKHRFEYCPHCGSAMIPKIQNKEDKPTDWEQLTLFDSIVGGSTSE